MGSVTECGLKGYETRHAAKQAARGHHDSHVRPYRCRGGCDYWHVGALPEAVIRGDVTAGELYDHREASQGRRSPAGQLRRSRISAARILKRDSEALAEMWADMQTSDRDLDQWKAAQHQAARMIDQLQQLMRIVAGPAASD
jgi:hypothetical protein